MKYLFKAISAFFLFLFHIIYHPIIYIGRFIWSLKIVSFRQHLITMLELNDSYNRDIDKLRRETFSQTTLRWLKGNYYW